MSHGEAVELIRGISQDRVKPSVWADLGCGTGTFTLALADLLPEGSKVYALDRSPEALKHLPQHHKGVTIESQVVDFVHTEVPGGLDGILMANSLHYVSNKIALLQRLCMRLAPGGEFLLVEYDTSRPNEWVPYPLTKTGARKVFATIGFSRFTELGTRPSVYRRDLMFAAVAGRSSGSQ